MNKKIKLAVVTALALGASSAFATNGDIMIGQGAKSRSMGGIGIAKTFGAESSLANPANISSVEKSEATLAVTVFMPSVAVTGPAEANFFSTGSADSASNLSVIPEIYYATRLSDNVVTGIAIAGTAGMGVDYNGETNGVMRMKTALSLLKVAVPVSYSVGKFTAAVEGVLQYGSLELSHINPNTGSLLENGASTDIGYGIEAGATYTTNGLTLGAVYKSEIGMTYDNTISASVAAFDSAPGGSTGITSGDNLAQPAERGVGISYEMGANTISADYKNIAYGDAAGYSDFGWDDQDIYAVGYEYASESYAVRLGYNYAKSPISEQDTAAAQAKIGSVKNFFNLSGFPGIVETHYTIGGGYNVSDALSIDGSFIYAPEVSNSYAVNGLTGVATSTVDVKHSQMALTLAMSYKY